MRPQKYNRLRNLIESFTATTAKVKKSFCEYSKSHDQLVKYADELLKYLQESELLPEELGLNVALPLTLPTGGDITTAQTQMSSQSTQTLPDEIVKTTQQATQTQKSIMVPQSTQTIHLQMQESIMMSLSTQTLPDQPLVSKATQTVNRSQHEQLLNLPYTTSYGVIVMNLGTLQNLDNLNYWSRVSATNRKVRIGYTVFIVS